MLNLTLSIRLKIEIDVSCNLFQELYYARKYRSKLYKKRTN